MTADVKKSPRNAFPEAENSPFDTYKKVWNKYQDKNDRQYQRELQAKNVEIHHRMKVAEERRLTDLVNKKNEANFHK